MEPSARRAADMLRQARRAVVLTGAGISAESGIAPFRGMGGIWSRYDPMEYATAEALARDPAKVWRMLHDLGREVAAARPNPAHQALARWEEARPEAVSIVTQNVDGLHQRAGSRTVIELHGGGSVLWCMACRGRIPAEQVDVRVESLPPRCRCGGVLRPDVVLFGEPLSEAAWMRAQDLAREADVALVVGTSVEVAPAAWLPGVAKKAGASLIEINPERTWITETLADVVVPGAAGSVLPALLAPVCAPPS